MSVLKTFTFHKTCQGIFSVGNLKAKLIKKDILYKQYRLLSASNLCQANRKLNLNDIPNIREFLASQTVQNNCNDVVEENHPYLDKVIQAKEKYPFGKTVYFECYGCQMNVNDTEYAWSILKNSGFHKTEDYSKADVILVVTCSIREKAEDKIWKRLKVLKKLKMRHESRQYPKIGILGCMAERLKNKILDKEKAVDVIAGPDAYRDLPRLLEETTEDSKTAINVMLSVDETYADIVPVRFDSKSKSAFVSIMRGCDNMCSYCIVPFTRGRERSRPISSIADEVRILSEQGIKQVTLLGQNVNSYRDTSVQQYSASNSNLSKGFKTLYKEKVGGMRFADLLDKISSVDPEMRIRFTSPHPKDFPDEVLQIMKERNNICKQIHLPAQSGSSNVLKSMRRGHTREDYLELVDRIRSYMPDITISTDMISGFCGETEEDHRLTVDLMNIVKYNYAFMFKYSMRGKTHAYHRMKDDVDEVVKQQRLADVINSFENNLPLANNKFVGQNRLVLIEKVSVKSDDDWLGRCDGNLKVILPRHQTLYDVTSKAERKTQVGDYVNVKITEYHPNTFKSQPIEISSIEHYSKNFALP